MAWSACSVIQARTPTWKVSIRPLKKHAADSLGFAAPALEHAADSLGFAGPALEPPADSLGFAASLSLLAVLRSPAQHEGGPERPEHS